MSYQSLLTSLCSIQAKTMELQTYEQVPQWNTIAASVPCRKDSTNRPKYADGSVRVNTDDDTFYFMPGVNISRGNRILLADNGKLYDVVKVNESYGKSSIHHLEVLAQLVDNN